MSDSNENATAPAQAAEPPLPTPSPTFYMEMTKELITAIIRVTDAIPEFGNPVVAPEFVARKRYLPPAFVESAIAALLSSPEVQNIPSLNVLQTLDDKQFVDAFKVLRAHLRTTLKGVDRVVRAREARLVAAAQQIYDFSKAFARDAETPISDHVALMKQSRQPRRKAAGEVLLPARKEGDGSTNKP